MHSSFVSNFFLICNKTKRVIIINIKTMIGGFGHTMGLVAGMHSRKKSQQ